MAAVEGILGISDVPVINIVELQAFVNPPIQSEIATVPHVFAEVGIRGGIERLSRLPIHDNRIIEIAQLGTVTLFRVRRFDDMAFVFERKARKIELESFSEKVFLVTEL